MPIDVMTIAYDAAGRETGITRFVTAGGATVASVLAYDNADRLTTMTYTSSVAGALATYAYSYDVASQVPQAASRAAHA
jgi:YD repeat-containing protein